MAVLSGNATACKETWNNILVGNFVKYIQRKDPNDPDIVYKVNTDCNLLDSNFQPIKSLKSETILKVLTRTKENIKMVAKRSGAIKVDIEGTIGYLKLSDVRKPTGKLRQIIDHEFLQYKETGVYEPFKADHDQEEDAIRNIIESTDDCWVGEIYGEPFQVLKLKCGQRVGRSNPKTDIQLVVKNLYTKKRTDLRISMKASNAVFFENWMLPQRFKQVFKEETRKEEVIDSLMAQGQIWKNGPTSSTSKQMFMCIGTTCFSKSKVELTTEEKYEAITGKIKFGKIKQAGANCVYSGITPRSLAELVENCIPARKFAEKTTMFASVRTGTKSSPMIDIKGTTLELNQRWINELSE